MFKTQLTTIGTPISELTPGSDQKVLMVCTQCGLEREVIWNNYQNMCKRRNTDPKSGWNLCRSCSCKKTARARTSKSAWNKGLLGPMGQHHPTWKGGEYIGSDGYKNIYVGKRKYIREHIKVVQDSLNRELTNEEVVHHIDGDKLNNEISNLYVCSFREHRNAHQSLQELGYLLIRLGLIKFSNGKYEADLKLRELLEHLEEAAHFLQIERPQAAHVHRAVAAQARARRSDGRGVAAVGSGVGPERGKGHGMAGVVPRRCSADAG